MEILELAREINFTNSEDQVIWKYESNGIYSSKSLYDIVNFRGIQPVYLPSVWELKNTS
jgi:hypothetical protein